MPVRPKSHSGVMRQLWTLGAEGRRAEGMIGPAAGRRRLPVRLGEARPLVRRQSRRRERESRSRASARDWEGGLRRPGLVGRTS